MPRRALFWPVPPEVRILPENRPLLDHQVLDHFIVGIPMKRLKNWSRTESESGPEVGPEVGPEEKSASGKRNPSPGVYYPALVYTTLSCPGTSSYTRVHMHHRGSCCTSPLHRVLTAGSRCTGRTLWAQYPLYSLGKSLSSVNPAQSCLSSSRNENREDRARKDKNGERLDRSGSMWLLVTLGGECGGRDWTPGIPR